MSSVGGASFSKEEALDQVRKLHASQMVTIAPATETGSTTSTADATLVDFRSRCAAVLKKIEDLLTEKNARYGNSALEPLRLLARYGPEAQIRVRIDDKLKRLANLPQGDDEDTLLDLAGYFVLLLIARKG